MDEQTKTTVGDFVTMLSDTAGDFLSKEKIKTVLGDLMPSSGFLGIGGGPSSAIASTSSEEIARRAKSLIDLFVAGFGFAFTEEQLENIYSKLEKKYSPVIASKTIIPLIPSEYLEKYRLQYLSKEELEALVMEKTRANKELRELDQKKTEFITIVAHQLRTPLTGMKWTLNMLVKGDLGQFSDEQKKALTKCAENNERLITLVEKVLSASQLGLAQYEIHLGKADIIAIVKDVISANSSYARAKSVTLDLKTEGDIPEMMIDRDKMRSVFENLVDNAIKYSRNPGKVSVELRRKDGVLECKVEDNGIGLPADEAGQLFSKFFRAKNAREAEPDGNGLGLFIIKGIIELHGGKIWFESKENQGTVFYFTIPIQQ